MLKFGILISRMDYTEVNFKTQNDSDIGNKNQIL